MIGLFSISSFAEDEGVVLRGFADVSLQQSRLDETSKFALGGVDFFLTKSLDKKTDFLVELVFEQNSAGELATDLERAYLKYKINPWLNISAGRFHTALGYWNETYHHGSYLYTSITRPFMFRFEDDGGIFPVHTIGLEFRGNDQIAGNNAGYIVDIGNGRGLQNDPPQTAGDANKSKSLSAVVYYETTSGLRLGASFYTDEMPAGTFTTQAADPADANRVVQTTTTVNSSKEQIAGAHLLYSTPLFELLTEMNKLVHKYNDVAQTTVNIDAYYTQLSLHFDKLTPFYRYELNSTDVPDVYTGLAANRIIKTVGLRYELSEASCLKLQYEDQVNTDTITSASVAWGW